MSEGSRYRSDRSRTPERVTPTLTELSGGDTALVTVALVSVGLGTIVYVPGMVVLLLGRSVAVGP